MLTAGRELTSVVGVDLSAAMVEVAHTRAAGLANASFLRADAQVHPFPTAGVDVVVSRTGASFFGDAPAAFANLARATAPGGRLALLTWQAPAHNEWFVEVTAALAGRPMGGPPPGVPSPFALADPDVVRDLLGGAGYADVQLTDVREPAQFGDDPVAACDVMADLLGWLLDGRDAGEARGALLDTMRAHEGCVGISAPQLGELIRMVAVDVTGHPKATSSNGELVLCDPVVVRSRGAEVAREGCLSLPHLTANVRRATEIEVAASTLEGDEIAFDSQGFEARCLLHEIDHLDGLLFLDRVDSLATDVFRRKNYR
jgi:peptide deformylase